MRAPDANEHLGHGTQGSKALRKARKITWATREISLQETQQRPKSYCLPKEVLRNKGLPFQNLRFFQAHERPYVFSQRLQNEVHLLVLDSYAKMALKLGTKSNNFW